MDIKNLFSKEILDYLVQTSKLGTVSYVNLDNAATTPPFLSVQKSVDDYLAGYGSVHRGAGIKSQISTNIYEQSREELKEFVGAPSDAYVLFTGNTTGAMNTAAHFFSFLKGKVMVSSVEHSSSWLPWIKHEGEKALGTTQVTPEEMDAQNKRVQELGAKQIVRYDVNKDFEFDLADIERRLQENKVKVLVLTACSNITGYRPDVKAVGTLAHKYGAYFLVDACQCLPHTRVDMQDLGIDFLVASGHKFYAPYGGGFLIGPKKFFDTFLPYQIGGGNLPYITEGGEFLRYKNQLAHDPGTPNAVGAVAMMYAVRQLKELGAGAIEAHEHALAEKLYAYLADNPKIEVFVSKKQLNTVLPFRVIGMDSAEVARRLNDEYGIGVRAGSFCVYHVVRKLLGITDESEIVRRVREGDTGAVPSLVRASIGLCNSEEDINRIIEALGEITK